MPRDKFLKCGRFGGTAELFFWQALCAAEDETDVQAAKTVAAEQQAEMAEFDENIPWDEKESEAKRERDDATSKVEQELALIQKEVRRFLSEEDTPNLCRETDGLSKVVLCWQLTPVERYAVQLMEAQSAPDAIEELQKAEVSFSCFVEAFVLH